MRQNHIISLLQETYTTVRVKYNPNGPSYTFKYDRMAALSLKEGDLVIVASKQDPFAFSVGMVTGIDEDPDINLDVPYDYKWLVGKVDLDSYNAQIEREKVITKKLQQLERVSQREKIMKQMQASVIEGSESAKLLESIVSEISNKEQN